MSQKHVAFELVLGNKYKSKFIIKKLGKEIYLLEMIFPTNQLSWKKNSFIFIYSNEANIQKKSGVKMNNSLNKIFYKTLNIR